MAESRLRFEVFFYGGAFGFVGQGLCFAISIVFDSSKRQPMVQGQWMWMYFGPLIDRAFFIFLSRSKGWAIDAVATYGIWWAAAIDGMSFFHWPFPFDAGPDGVVVVDACQGVLPERWTPVFA